MKFARDCRSSESNEATAQLLFEALPWIKNLTGKTVRYQVRRCRHG